MQKNLVVDKRRMLLEVEKVAVTEQMEQLVEVLVIFLSTALICRTANFECLPTVDTELMVSTEAMELLARTGQMAKTAKSIHLKVLATVLLIVLNLAGA
jgi:hypothetical protein